MSNLVGFSTARKTARCSLINAWLSGGTLKIYAAPKPADADTAITTQTLLATFTIPDPSGTVTNGVLTGTNLDAAMIVADGTAAWARALDSAGVTIADFDMGLTGSGAAVTVDNLSLIAGALVSEVSFALAES
ncbi:conserved hypothetical protein [Gammaproteobacteria bacterium]